MTRHHPQPQRGRLQGCDRRRRTRSASTRKAPARSTRSDIQLVDGLQVLNPDHLIATLDKKGPLSMELTVNVGRGYVPAERNKTPTMPIGTIPIDALFSPIRKVNYTVQNARVGQVTDYDKLTLEVWTNGAVTPAGRGRLRGEDPQGAALDLDQLRGDRRDELRRRRSATTSRSTRTSSARSTSSSSASARRTACRTRTSRSSASWCSAPSRTCSRPRTSAASR